MSDNLQLDFEEQINFIKFLIENGGSVLFKGSDRKAGRKNKPTTDLAKIKFRIKSGRTDYMLLHPTYSVDEIYKNFLTSVKNNENINKSRESSISLSIIYCKKIVTIS